MNGNAPEHAGSTTAGRPGTGNFREHASNLKDDVKNLKDDVAGAAGAVADRVSHEAHKAADFAKAGSDKVHDAHTTIRHYVSAHPTTATLVTLAVGIMVGKLLSH